MASWKISPNPNQKIEYIPLLNSRKFFAVDDSGSTTGGVLRRERAFVDQLREKHGHPEDSVSLWGSACDNPTKDSSSIWWRSNHGGTIPAGILQNAAALATIKKSDAWFLITDGEIWDGSVHHLAELAHQSDVLSVPVVFLIVGSRGSTPLTTNISVGITFFAGSQDTLILFKETETGKIYVIAGKGCFSSLGGGSAAPDLTSWSNMPIFSTESKLFKHCADLNIVVPTVESRASFPKGVSLGGEWERAHDGPVWVDLEAFLQAGMLSDEDLFDVLAEEAFNNLAVAYKTRKCIPDLRAFVQAQKVEMVAPKLEDVWGAADIIKKMGRPETTEDERTSLQERLREAHAKNRQHYQKMVAEFNGSPKEQALRRRNQLVDAAMRSLASIEAASFNAEILSRRSNRARRAEAVSTDNAIEMAKLNLEGPSFKGYCLVCCGEAEIMSICLKELDAEHIDDNTTDFALNFPLAAGASAKNVNMISSQNICFQCALLGPSGMSIYKEKLKAIIPAVSYEGMNKKYVNDQLYLALTTGLATGAAGIAQLFMAILDAVLRTKPWAGAGLEDSQLSAAEQHEAVQRRQTFRWMLDQLVEHTWTRENFTETGEWVAFPKALAWAAKDFETNNLSSFAVTYPVAGFSTLVSLGEKIEAFSDQLLQQLDVSKAVYSVVSKYLADFQIATNSTPRDDSGLWKQKYLETIYQDFNAPFIPRDMRGSQSLVTDTDVFFNRLSACLAGLQDLDSPQITTAEKVVLMRKIQLVLFWLIYELNGHCTAQTFFNRIQHNKHVASAVLDPSLRVPESELHSVLLSIFASRADSQLIDSEAANRHMGIIPFRTPFGASVLRCGLPSCNEPFHTSDLELTVANIEAIRQGRAQHLIKVFGIQNRFERSNGLPERTDTGKSPSSIHTNLHISVARTWAETAREKRRAILDAEDEREGFVTSVRKRICEQGRGDVFSQEIDQDVRDVLPSFFEVLGQALMMDGKSDEDATVYEYDFEMNTMEEKIRWEMRAERG